MGITKKRGNDYENNCNNKFKRRSCKNDNIKQRRIYSCKQGNRVLLVDNDKQGDASRGLNRRTQDGEGIDRIMTARHPEDWMNKLIKHTDFEGLDVLPANMRLLSANQEVMLDQTRPQQFRIRDALECVKDQYDF